MRKGKMYKKFLSCVLAAAMVVTSGVVYPSTGKAESSESTVERTEFKDHNGKSWYIVPENYLGKKGVIQDAEGILYQLMQDGSKSTAIVIGFESTRNSSITIPSAVPINYENYNKYMESGETPKRMPEGTKWNASDVTVVAERAFASSPIEKVTVPESVLEIRDEAFAFCATLKELHWKVSEKIDVVIGENILNSSSNCKIISSNKVVKQYAQDKKYAISSEEASPSPSDSEIPSDEPTPTQVPTATPVVSTPTVTASIVPTVTPAVATPTVPTATPAIATPTVPTATPAVATATPVVATPVAPTATPKVPGHPVVVPPSVTDPVVQTPTPGETLAPTAVPTEVVITPAPASEKPAITEIPAITEAPTVTEVPEKPVEPTPIPAKPTVAPVPETVAEKDNVSYEVNQNTKSVSVSSMSDVKDRKVTIPSTVKINGVTYNVTSIDKNAFRNNKKITTVTIGNNVTTIKAGAFQGCKKLTSVKFPSKLRTISPNSFKGCSKLLTVNMPKTVSKIGEAAFKDCTSLKEVSIGNAPKKNLGGLSFDESQIRYGASTVTINIGAKAFENCKKLNKVIINALVKIIGKSAFKDCKSLRSILIYSKVLKKVKGGALTGVNNCKISVPAKKVAPYKILFKNKGQGKKVVVAKL